MLRKSSTEVSWLCAVIVAVNCWPSATGCAPSEPTDTVLFCWATAVVMSVGVSWNCASLSGSIQIRIA